MTVRCQLCHEDQGEIHGCGTMFVVCAKCARPEPVAFECLPAEEPNQKLRTHYMQDGEEQPCNCVDDPPCRCGERCVC